MSSRPDGIEPVKTEFGHNEHGLREEVDRIDSVATAPGVTYESFAHLDEKKILRKVRSHPSAILRFEEIVDSCLDGCPSDTHARPSLPAVISGPSQHR